jgi:cytoskeletal protein CcmA (bactofilin family)
MIFRRKADAAPAEAPRSSRLPAHAVLEGALAGVVDLAVHGRIVGDVEASGVVTVAAGAEIGGTVHARSVVVAGKVSGPVVADEKVEILPGGSVDGDLTSPHVVIADGADLHGKVDVRR